MTPPEHALTGALAATLAAAAWPGAIRGRGRWVAWATAGALAPDLDALSLLFSHTTYFGFAWYAHRAFLHSLAGCAALAMLMPALLAAAGFGRARDPALRARAVRTGAMSAFAGGLIHLVGDLPTPPGPWGGIPLFFPLPARFGGWSHLGWVNAALFYLLGAAALAAGALAAAHSLSPRAGRPWLRASLAGVAGLALAGTVWFTSISRYEGPAQWRLWQARFIPVVWIDALHDAGRGATVFWEREILSVR